MGKLKKEINGNTLSLTTLSFGDFACGCLNQIQIWNVNDWKLKRTLNGHTNLIWDLIALDNNCLISASTDKTIKIWNLNNGAVMKTLIGTRTGY